MYDKYNSCNCILVLICFSDMFYPVVPKHCFITRVCPPPFPVYRPTHDSLWSHLSPDFTVYVRCSCEPTPHANFLLSYAFIIPNLYARQSFSVSLDKCCPFWRKSPSCTQNLSTKACSVEVEYIQTCRRYKFFCKHCKILSIISMKCIWSRLQMEPKCIELKLNLN